MEIKLEDVRNVKAISLGRYDLEYNHPVHGWIPFTADPHDSQTLGRVIHAFIAEGNAGEIPKFVSPEIPLETIRRMKITAIRQKAQETVYSLIDNYPEFAKLLWNEQEREAKEFLTRSQGVRVITPILSTIATRREMTVEQVADSVIEKANTFRKVAADVEGYRQYLEDQIWQFYNLQDRDSLKNIDWNYTPLEETL